MTPEQMDDLLARHDAIMEVYVPAAAAYAAALRAPYPSRIVTSSGTTFPAVGIIETQDRAGPQVTGVGPAR